MSDKKLMKYKDYLNLYQLQLKTLFDVLPNSPAKKRWEKEWDKWVSKLQKSNIDVDLFETEINKHILKLIEIFPDSILKRELIKKMERRNELLKALPKMNENEQQVAVKNEVIKDLENLMRKGGELYKLKKATEIIINLTSDNAIQKQLIEGYITFAQEEVGIRNSILIETANKGGDAQKGARIEIRRGKERLENFVEWLKEKQKFIQVINVKNKPAIKQLFSFKWQPETEIEPLYNKMKGVFIDSDTKLEQFKDIFTRQLVESITPIKWIDRKTVLAYFIDKAFEKNKFPMATDIWATAEWCFINAGNLAMNKQTYLNNKTGKPKNYSKIDELF